MLTGKQQEYIHHLEFLGWNKEELDRAQEELEDENHPRHKERLEDFAGFMLKMNFWTEGQHRNFILDTVGYTQEEYERYYE